MAATEVAQLWQTAFPDRTRPELYSRRQYNEDGFHILTGSQDFLMDTSFLDGNQLHTLALNNQIALQAAQAEYLALENQVNQIKHKDPLTRPTIKDPSALLDHYVYEERKESVLYGYKYDPKRILQGLNPKDISEAEKQDTKCDQDPWQQGGFVPGKRQADAMRNKAVDPHNPDGWTPIIKDGRSLVPKLYVDTPVSFNERYGRYNVAITKTAPLQSALLSDTRRAAANGAPSLNGEEALMLINKPLRNTRYNGAKVPQTRDVSEVPVSRAGTPKRKRGDTPFAMSSQESPAAKKAKVAQPVQGEPPRRKRHNQYTKARERAELAAKAEEAARAAQAAEAGSSTVPVASIEQTAPVSALPAHVAAPAAPISSTAIVEHPSPPRKVSPARKSSPAKRASPMKRTKPARPTKEVNGLPFWMSLTAAEKFSYDQWSAKDLLDAVVADRSWLSGPFMSLEPNLPPKIRERVNDVLIKLPQVNHPTRSWAAYRTWIRWAHQGNDKRGPRRNPLKDDSARDSTAEPETPEPADHDKTAELVPGEKTMGTGPVEIAGAEPIAMKQDVVEEDTKLNTRPRRKVRG